MTSPEQAVSSNIGQATLWEKLDIFQGLLSLGMTIDRIFQPDLTV